MARKISPQHVSKAQVVTLWFKIPYISQYQHCILDAGDFEVGIDHESDLPSNLDLRMLFLSSLFFVHDSLLEVGIENLCPASDYH